MAFHEKRPGKDNPGNKIRRESNGNKNRMAGFYQQCIGNGRILFDCAVDFLSFFKKVRSINLDLVVISY